MTIENETFTALLSFGFTSRRGNKKGMRHKSGIGFYRIGNEYGSLAMTLDDEVVAVEPNLKLGFEEIAGCLPPTGRDDAHKIVRRVLDYFKEKAST